MSDNIFHDRFRRDLRNSSILDADLEFRVNRILSKIPGQLKQRTYDNYPNLSSYSPVNPSKTYSPYTTSYSSYEKDRKAYHQPSSTASSFFLDKYGANHLKKSLFTSTSSYLDTELRGRREKSPLKDYRDALNQRIDEAIHRSKNLTKQYSSSPIMKKAHYPIVNHVDEIELINEKADRALRRSWDNLKRSGHYSPYHSHVRSVSPVHQNLSHSYFLSADKVNRRDSPLKGSYLASKSSLAYERRTPSKYTALFSESKYSAEPSRHEWNDVDQVFNEAMRRSQAILNKSKSKEYSAVTKPAFHEQRRLYEEFGRSETKYPSRVESALKSVVETKTREVLYSDKGDKAVFNNAHATLSPNQKVKVVDETYEDGSGYKGDKLRGKRHGRGVYVYQNGSKYDGEWEDNLRSGYGVLSSGDKVEYEGEWLEDKYHGTGNLNNIKVRALSEAFDYKEFSKLNGAWTKYEGEFQLGKWHGLGTLYLSNGEKLVGKFKYDQVDGSGTFYQKNGENLTGEWSNNKFSGSL